MAEKDKIPTLASMLLKPKGKRPRAPLQSSFDLFSEPATLTVEPRPAVAEASAPTLPTAPEPVRPAPQRVAPERSQEPPPEPRIWTVRDLVSNVRTHIEDTFADLQVLGEISNLRIAPSGHLYFTLKDGEAQLPVVLFRRQAQLLRFRPKDGDEVRVRGRISIYESRGQLQLIAETLELRGAGALQLAFERLKARLLAEGLFDSARKRPLPAYPKCVGVITAARGAALQDIITVIRRRHAHLNLLIYPATMQGPNCPATVAAGIRWFNAQTQIQTQSRHPDRTVDLILIARGGGSAEDLAGFNNEALARTIAASTLPVVSAVGHEVDFTIADFVADLRAATPSAAAELITASQHQVQARIDRLTDRARRALQLHLLRTRARLARLSAESVLARVRNAVSRRDQHLDDLRFRLQSAATRRLQTRASRLEALTARLRRQDPRLRLAVSHRRLASAEACLTRAAHPLITRRRTRLDQATARLHALSPLAVLNRGYALVYSAQGTLLLDPAATAPGQPIRARLAHGSITAIISETHRS